MSSFNAIIPGSPWSQTFRFPAGVFGVGENLVIEVRRNPASPVLLTVSDSVVVVNNDHTVNLTALETAGLEGLPGVIFDLKTDFPRHLGLRAHIPVRAPA